MPLLSPPQMPPELLAALALFAIVSSVTPGPNNTMLLASGANFGLRRTLPHMAGIVVGCAVLISSVGLALGAVFTAYPILHTILKFVGAGYLLWLAWKIAWSHGLSAAGVGAKPFTFLQAAAFQWVNPKAWVMALGALSAYAPQEGYFANVLVVVATFAILSWPCIAVWAGFGVALRGLLSDPKRLKIFNWTMAALLVLSILPIFLEG